jgi:hypothetical protein
LESELNKKLNILNIDFIHGTFETHDLSIEQFINDKFIGKPSEKNFKVNTPIKSLIIQLRQATDDYE